MGIKNLQKNLVEIGKIKIGGVGEKRSSRGGKDWRPPVKFNHFKVTTLEKDSNDNFVADTELMQLIGNNPKSLDIFVLSDDPDKIFLTSYAMYAGSKCVCRGDGEVASRRVTKDDKGIELKEAIYKEVPCDYSTCEFAKSKKCKPNGMLSCMLKKSRKIGGVHKFRTTSWNSIVNVSSSLEALKLMTGGILFGIPLKLELIEKQTEEHGKVKVVNITFAGSIEEIQLLSSQQKQLRLDGSVSMVSQNKLIESSGILQDTDNDENVQAEYYHEEKKEVKKGVKASELSSNLPPINKKVAKKVVKKNSDNGLF